LIPNAVTSDTNIAHFSQGERLEGVPPLHLA